MARPKSADPAEPVTLRVPRSVLAAYQAMGSDWRDLMVEALRAAAGPQEAAPAPPKPAARAQPARVQKAAPAPALVAVPAPKPRAPRLIGFDPVTKAELYG